MCLQIVTSLDTRVLVYRIFKASVNVQRSMSYKHKAERVRQETLLNYVSPITSLLEKSYTQRSSFSELHTVIDKLVEACVKYSDYLSANLQSVNEYHELEENENASEVFSLPVCGGSWRSQYKIQREQYSMEYILEKLEFAYYYEPVFLGNIIPVHKAHRYAFIKKLKTLGLEVPGVVLFCRQYGPANGNHLERRHRGRFDVTSKFDR